MEIKHEIKVNLTADELGEALAGCTAKEFTRVWMSWEDKVKAVVLDEIAQNWESQSHNNGRVAFLRLLKRMDYWEMNRIEGLKKEVWDKS